MNTKLTSGLLGIGALLMASQVNATTVQIIPASTTIELGTAISLTIQGIDFAPTNGGGFTLTWDPSALDLASTALEITSNLFNNGLGGNSVSIIQGQLDIIRVVSPAVPLSGNFDITEIIFIAISPPTNGVTDINISVIQPWVDENNIDLAPALQPDYVGASIRTVPPGNLPIPAAVWLFGSGLIGLIGLARRKAHS